MPWVKNKTRQLICIPSMPEHDLYDLVYIFVTGGLIGTIYEMLLILLLHHVWEDRSGSILTPVNYVYALGAVSIFVLMRRLKRPLTVFVLGTVLGGVVEYGLSLIQECLLGSRSWDYAARPLNLNGRTTVPYMLIWGMLCYLAMRFVFPALLRLIHQIPSTLRIKIAAALLALFLIDAAVTLLAVARYSGRANGIYFDSTLINLVDRTFDNAFMGVHFPNMILTSGGA